MIEILHPFELLELCIFCRSSYNGKKIGYDRVESFSWTGKKDIRGRSTNREDIYTTIDFQAKLFLALVEDRLISLKFFSCGMWRYFEK